MPPPKAELTLEVSRHYAEQHLLGSPKHPASVFALRKVCERGLADFQAAPFPGTDPRPWVEARAKCFLAALDGALPESADADLLPAGHPLRKRETSDPWGDLLEAEERIQALQKSLVDTVTRALVRKISDHELVGMNRRLSHLYGTNFAGSERTESVVGIQRAKVVSAAALVHEELERRALLAPDEPPTAPSQAALYAEAMKLRESPEVVLREGALVQHPGGVELRLEHASLFVAGRPLELPVAKLAERFSPAGSSAHEPFLEPREALYTRPPAGAGEGVEIGKFTYAEGAKTSAFAELFVAGALTGVLVVGKTSVMLRESLVPYVLTEHAVATGYMPPEGESQLPGTLEWDVPPELRYWKAASDQDPREIRDQLVRSGLFTEEHVRIVDGAVRRTALKRFVVEPYPASPSAFAELLVEQRPEVDLYARYMGDPAAITKATAVAVQLADMGSVDGLADGAALYFADDSLGAVRACAQQLPAVADKYLVGAHDGPEMRELFKRLGRAFRLPHVPDRLFVASHPVDVEVEWVDSTLPIEAESAARELGKREVRVVKGTAAEEEHFVLGVVLEPETIDSQQDIYSAEEVRKSAHRFMAHYQNAGLMHQTLVNDAVRIVESYLAPLDCEIGGQTVKQGSWIMGMIVEDDGLWSAVKDGTLTGFSIGGSAIRTAEETAA